METYLVHQQAVRVDLVLRYNSWSVACPFYSILEPDIGWYILSDDLAGASKGETIEILLSGREVDYAIDIPSNQVNENLPVEFLKRQKSLGERKRQQPPALSAGKTQWLEILKTPQMLPRWKGKTSQATALANPLSQIVSLLKSSLVQSDIRGLLSGSSVLVYVTEELSDLFNRSCFGRQLLTADKDKRWFQLGLEEAFYLHNCLGCLPILGKDGHPETSEDLWRHMTNRNSKFPESYRAYSHLRGKNWIVRPGSQYGVDFVAYRHHPALVHSEYAVLVLKDGDGQENNGRLREWSDFHCTVRLCGSVAKQLLVIYVNRGGQSPKSLSSIGLYTVEERLISRWSPKECREGTVGDESVPQQSECLRE